MCCIFCMEVDNWSVEIVLIKLINLNYCPLFLWVFFQSHILVMKIYPERWTCFSYLIQYMD